MSEFCLFQLTRCSPPFPPANSENYSNYLVLLCYYLWSKKCLDMKYPPGLHSFYSLLLMHHLLMFKILCWFLMCSRIYPDKDSVVSAALNMASTIAKKSPIAVTGTKHNLNYSRDHSVDEGLKYIVSILNTLCVSNWLCEVEQVFHLMRESLWKNRFLNHFMDHITTFVCNRFQVCGLCQNQTDVKWFTVILTKHTEFCLLLPGNLEYGHVTIWRYHEGCSSRNDQRGASIL